MSYAEKISNGVLIVEDDPDSSFILEHRLKKLKIPVLDTVVTGEAAVKKTEELNPDIILMDIMLQGEMDGIQAATQITNQYDVPIIFLTAHSDQNILDRAASSGHYGYLLKPTETRQLGVSIDVTLRQHQLEQELAVSRAWFKETISGIGDSVITTNTEGIIDFVNPAGLSMFRCSEEEIVGKNLSEAISIRKEQNGEVTQNLINTSSDEGQYLHGEFSIQVGNQDVIPVDITIIPIMTKGTRVGWVIFMHDITRRKKYQQDLISAHDNLENYKEELQQLGDHMRIIQENERGSISREIHDEIAQNLARIRMDIQAVRGNSGQETADLLKHTSELVGECISSVRRIATELRPRILDDVGLIAAVQWQVNQFIERENLDIQLTHHPDEFDLEGDKAVDIFRIIQESLNNIVNHAGASKVYVELNQKKESIELSIKDDGKGFKKEALQSAESLGIVGMRERARRWEGSCSITSTLGEGTAVNVKIPDH